MALVGPSGSGKSTIAKLLLRFYDPLQGSVMVDGISLQEINVAWWRSRVGYVSQRPILFPGTIRFNIACGIEGREATDEEVFAAAKAACAGTFVKISFIFSRVLYSNMVSFCCCQTNSSRTCQRATIRFSVVPQSSFRVGKCNGFLLHEQS
jgi:ABC-type transport system involved in Fe-S cluster assembly fused permease/ATPase subunit